MSIAIRFWTYTLTSSLPQPYVRRRSFEWRHGRQIWPLRFRHFVAVFVVVIEVKSSLCVFRVFVRFRGVTRSERHLVRFFLFGPEAGEWCLKHASEGRLRSWSKWNCANGPRVPVFCFLFRPRNDAEVNFSYSSKPSRVSTMFIVFIRYIILLRPLLNVS